MINTTFHIPERDGLNILFLGAHSDDIEIGCGGTILKLIDDYQIEQVNWVVFTSNESRKREALKSAKSFLGPVSNSNITIFDYQDGYLPSVWGDVKNEFERLKEAFSPDLVFTHYRNDLHQDHRLINELTWNTFRDHLILEYEIPKYDGDIGHPNFFVTLSDFQIDRKKQIILDSFKSQLNKHWLDDTLLTSMLRIRGVEGASKSKFAEAFYARKIII